MRDDYTRVRSLWHPIAPSPGFRLMREERRQVYTVSRLNQEIQTLIDGGFRTLWLDGELSNLARPGSGHWYFSLKDSRAQIRCAMFRARARLVRDAPSNGDAVRVRGKVTLYAARGDVQLIVEHLEPAGTGRLQALFERTRRELETAGWFDADAKRAIPAMPERIGVITSPSGAAIRDVLQVLARRWPRADIRLFPTPVQGTTAVPGIVAALERANRTAGLDVLLLVRGGGSLEDLWSFNDRAVAAAIRASVLPVVSGVGHEVDVTIADLVADLRAPTPSAAAELATPDGERLRVGLVGIAETMQRRLTRRLATLRRELETTERRLAAQRPERRLRDRAQRVDDLSLRLQRLMHRRLQTAGTRFETLAARITMQTPLRHVTRRRDTVVTLERRLGNAMHARLRADVARVGGLARALDSLSPLATLERGFAAVFRNAIPVTRAATLNIGDIVTLRMSDGEADTQVRDVRPRTHDA